MKKTCYLCKHELPVRLMRESSAVAGEWCCRDSNACNLRIAGEKGS